MNERIRGLAEQAGFHFDAYNEVTNRKAELFAELIIKECIDTVSKRYMGDNNREDMEVRRCVEALKQKFGV